ncbi:lasso peptide biosynthesis PqqD family chaperone [Bacillus sp. DX1.1]|uniref:lasso peptide biosynthesis PqqD family chaperone n=1 Tax=unclassified Bacillus (in: firmicutes) TaxID=185979 RepID=UPI002570BCAA|nr:MULTISPECIES: lasso peptide biosynthesis PqqD family chaperone [unclassified Bacillus (in: firmicutes)]MDM5157339.1 lasso peptide biosynthesis PqqD family chaperone [Bacillus sp. DX1.1]WJE81565.1 lasso peptide biosynthesis PqqD family chaperone [Bacillus sp. DX3.1]
MMSKQEISLNSFIVQGQENVVSDMDGEKVMMSIHNGKYYNLGGLGGEIWDLINELISVDQLVNILMSRYAIEEAECKKQVLSFLNHLYSEGLILINEKG